MSYPHMNGLAVVQTLPAPHNERLGFVMLLDAITSSEFQKRFWSKVDKSAGNDACWLWTASTTHGYGQIATFQNGKRKIIQAHRIAWAIFNRADIPFGMFVCHHCDNPTCVNPTHLFIGTAQDNTDDMMRKGRGNHRLRRAKKNRVQMAKYKEAQYGDAVLLLKRAIDGLPYSKEKMVKIVEGWNQARWRGAYALLCDAMIFRSINRQTEILISNRTEALSRLQLYWRFSVGLPELTEPVSCTELCPTETGAGR